MLDELASSLLLSLLRPGAEILNIFAIALINVREELRWPRAFDEAIRQASRA